MSKRNHLEILRTYLPEDLTGIMLDYFAHPNDHKERFELVMEELDYVIKCDNKYYSIINDGDRKKMRELMINRFRMNESYTIIAYTKHKQLIEEMIHPIPMPMSDYIPARKDEDMYRMYLTWYSTGTSFAVSKN